MGDMRAKILFATLILLLAVDAVMLHGHYRDEVIHKAEVVEETVMDQKWETPLVG